MTSRPQAFPSAYALPLALALLHLVLAMAFASVTPYRTAGMIATMRGTPANDIGAPDERQHANYVARIARGEGFAVLDPKDPNLYENYQAHQPPLYYILAAGWSKVVGVQDVRAAEAGLRIRALNAVVGAATIVGVFVLALTVVEDRRTAGLAAALAALLPMNLALSGAVSNDPLLIALCTWCLALTAKGIREGWQTKTALCVGALAGLAILTKTTGVALLPVLLAAACIRRPSPAQLAAAALPLLLLVLPWFARNQSLYGDPLAVSAFNQAFTGSPQARVFIDQFGAYGYWAQMVMWWTARSFVGVFGYMDIWLTDTSLPNGNGGMYTVVLGVFALGLLSWPIAASKSDRTTRALHALCAGFLLIVVLLFVRFNTQYFQAQARYLLPALGVVALAVASGITQMLRSRATFAIGLVVVPLVLADALALSRLPGEFQRRTASTGSANPG